MNTAIDLVQQQYHTIAERAISFQPPYVSQLAIEHRPPYQLLIAILLSLRTRDRQTQLATESLLSVAPNVEQLHTLDTNHIARSIRRCNYYRTKAQTLHRLAHTLCTDYHGNIPNRREQLLALPGIGIKTANLLLSSAFGIDAICVDTHVHRIANRIGWVATTNPADTERDLQPLFRRPQWSHLNDTLVRHGMNLCTPRSPHCTTCPIADSCRRNGVTHWR